MILTSTQLTNYLLNAGFSGIDLAAAIQIAYCESGFNTNAHNTNNEDSRGLFQINIQAWPEFKTVDLFDPQVNCNAAYKIYLKSGKKFSPWTCAKTLNLTNPKEIYFGIGIVFLMAAIYFSIAQ